MNIVLRLGYGAWIAADVYGVLLVLSALHLVRGILPPSDVLVKANAIGGDVVWFWARAPHLARAIEVRFFATYFPSTWKRT